MMKHIPASFKIIYAALGLVFLSIIVKLYILAIARHDYYDKLSRENTIKTEILVPTRGQILDRNGEPLAINEIGFSLSLKKGLSNKSLHEELEYIKSFIEDIDTQELNDTYIKYNISNYFFTGFALAAAKQAILLYIDIVIFEKYLTYYLKSN